MKPILFLLLSLLVLASCASRKPVSPYADALKADVSESVGKIIIDELNAPDEKAPIHF
jgi:hypothetical protein